ncbi:MAG: alcohol dehydrogenase family protein [Candidatus Promineifilaceae bacterium]
MIPQTMTAVLLTGHGGYDKLETRHDVPVPVAKAGEVLIRVGAAGVNNTDVNTRIGWYSKSVTSDTSAGGDSGYDDLDNDDASWSGVPLQLPRIQGADVCGEIVAVGDGVDAARIGERVLVSSLMRTPAGGQPFATWTFGSECDGGFAQFCTAPSAETHAVNSDWTDIELASIPCAYSTAENALHRVGLKEGETILITGASGGVGSAAVQLAKRRGVTVIAVCGAAKTAAVKALGADQVLDRRANLLDSLSSGTVDVVLDVVAGDEWPKLLDVLKRGGRYVTVGAIAGPMVELDVRTLYLKDLTLMGCTYQEAGVFENLVGYIERGEIRPIIAATYPLENIVEAQQLFLAKQFVGKLVLIPPSAI